MFDIRLFTYACIYYLIAGHSEWGTSVIHKNTKLNIDFINFNCKWKWVLMMNVLHQRLHPQIKGHRVIISKTIAACVNGYRCQMISLYMLDPQKWKETLFIAAWNVQVWMGNLYRAMTDHDKIWRNMWWWVSLFLYF